METHSMVLVGDHDPRVGSHDDARRQVERVSTIIRRPSANCTDQLLSAEKALYPLVAAVGIGNLFQVRLANYFCFGDAESQTDCMRSDPLDWPTSCDAAQGHGDHYGRVHPHPYLGRHDWYFCRPGHHLQCTSPLALITDESRMIAQRCLYRNCASGSLRSRTSPSTPRPLPSHRSCARSR